MSEPSPTPAYCRCCDHTHVVGTACWFAAEKRTPTPKEQEPMKDEHGWVIERNEPLPTGLPLYWRSSKLQLLGGRLEHYFNPKHEMAVRFARKEDADRIISWLAVPGHAVEHLWIGGSVQQSSAPSVPPSPKEQEPMSDQGFQVDYVCGCSDHETGNEVILQRCNLHRDGRPYRIRRVQSSAPSVPPEALMSEVEAQISGADGKVRRAALLSDHDYYRGWRDAYFNVRNWLRETSAPTPVVQPEALRVLLAAAFEAGHWSWPTPDAATRVARCEAAIDRLLHAGTAQGQEQADE